MWGRVVGQLCVVTAPVALVDGLDAMVGHKRFVARVSSSPSLPVAELAVELWNQDHAAPHPLAFLAEALKVAEALVD